jgi:hypothetical protein
MRTLLDGVGRGTQNGAGEHLGDRGSTGIGLAIAGRLAAGGHTVSTLARHAPPQAPDLPPRGFLAVACDITVEA